MSLNLIEDRLQGITGKIVREFKPDKIILFGSWAWGNPTADSDVDLFIIKESNQRRVDREKTVYRIILSASIPIDVIVYTPAEVERRLSFEDPFLTQILTKGTVLYAK